MLKDAIAGVLGRLPVIGVGMRRTYWTLVRVLAPASFPGSAAYWERRYSAGGTSGAGSYGMLGRFKADTINRFVETHGVRTVIEFGCGDGNQLALSNYPEYLGFDVSVAALSRCRKRFAADATKSFRLADDYAGEKADLVLSLDVVYHLVEDAVFDAYMRRVFDAAIGYVIVYSSDTDVNRGDEGLHVRHRRFTAWVSSHRPGFALIGHTPNPYGYRGDPRTGSFSDFFVYERARLLD